MTGRKNRILFVGIMLLIALSLVACGKEEYRMVRIDSFDGDVELYRDGEIEIFKGINLIPKDMINTGDDSGVLLLVDEDKHLSAGANTKFTVNATGSEKKGLVTIDVEYGETLVKINNKLPDESEFEISTPNATFSVRGTTFGVSYDANNGKSVLVVYEGVVEVYNGETRETIEAGDGAVVTEEGIERKEKIVKVLDKDDDMPSMDDFENDRAKAKVIKDLSKAKTGDTVYFGNWTYTKYNLVNSCDVDLGRGVEPTEWLVLDKQGDQILLISKYALCEKEYHHVGIEGVEQITWEECTLRSWLNNEYLYSGFSPDEQNRIVSTALINKDNNEHEASIAGGNNTNDKVFLLSIDEANTYFADDSERVFETADGWPTGWWLRSPGDNGNKAACAHSGGYVDTRGFGVFDSFQGVRPAIWVKY